MAISRTASQLRARGSDALNELEQPGITRGSYQTEHGVDEKTGKPTVTISWETAAQKVGVQVDDEGDIVYDDEGKTIQVPLGKLKDAEIKSRTFFADQEEDQALFFADKIGYTNLGFKKSDVDLRKGKIPTQVKSRRELERKGEQGPPPAAEVAPPGEEKMPEGLTDVEQIYWKRDHAK